VHETTTKLGTTVEIGNAGGMVAVCKAMINSLWHPLLEALSFMLERWISQTLHGALWPLLKSPQCLTYLHHVSGRLALTSFISVAVYILLTEM
jgi:hypothetical protein